MIASVLAWGRGTPVLFSSGSRDGSGLSVLEKGFEVQKQEAQTAAFSRVQT